MKRSTAILIVLVMLTSCALAVAEGTPNTELTGEIKFFTAFAGANGTDAMIAEFNKLYPNVTVNFEVYKNDVDGNVGLDTAIMAGDQVDVFLSFGVSNTAKRWQNGLLMDLTDRLAADGLDLVENWGTDAYKYNDRVYGPGMSIWQLVKS